VILRVFLTAEECEQDYRGYSKVMFQLLAITTWESPVNWVSQVGEHGGKVNQRSPAKLGTARSGMETVLAVLGVMDPTCEIYLAHMIVSETQ